MSDGMKTKKALNVARTSRAAMGSLGHTSDGRRSAAGHHMLHHSGGHAATRASCAAPIP